MMDDFERDLAHRNVNKLIDSTHMDAPKKLESYSEEQIDSGLGSLGGYSGELSSLQCGSLQEEVRQNENPNLNQCSNTSPERPKTSSVDLVSSMSKMNIDNSGDRCDSGVVEEDVCPQIHSNLSNNWIQPQFSKEQILEIFRGDEDGDNHLHLSIIHGLPEVTMQIINLAHDWVWLSQPNYLLQTPLHLAVITRQPAVVRRLVCAGALVTARDQMGNTPLHTACRLGFEDIVHMLLTPVRYEEVYQNRYKVPFQKIPQDLDTRNYEGLTCLHLAALGRHINVMRLLLSAGANVNAPEGKNGRTVLHMAADWGHIEMLKFLLTHNSVSKDANTYAGLTPILLAFGRNHEDAVEVLYRNGASCDILSLSEESDMESSEDEMEEDANYRVPLQTYR